MLRHERSRLAHIGLRRNGDDAAGHDVADGQLAERGIARDAPRQHIAVGDDAAEPAAVVRDGQDADAVVRQQLNSMAERRLRRNGDDIGIHKCADKHGFQTSGIKLAVHSDSMAQKRALDAKIPRIF